MLFAFIPRTNSSMKINLIIQVISYDSTRGGVSVITEKGEVTTSFLLIQNADLADSGKYSCSPSNADVASVRVHVLVGKYLATRFEFVCFFFYLATAVWQSIKLHVSYCIGASGGL